jgi:hypothetical protein
MTLHSYNQHDLAHDKDDANLSIKSLGISNQVKN